MNDKMREALELIRKEDDEWGSLGVKAREMVDEALATPPTEQTGRVISEDEWMDKIKLWATEQDFWNFIEQHSHAMRLLCIWLSKNTPAASLPSVEEITKPIIEILGEWEDGSEITLAKAIHALLADRLGKPVEVNLSHWAKTQGFDAWAADHAAVLRNLKAYLQSAGVRVKE